MTQEEFKLWIEDFNNANPRWHLDWNQKNECVYARSVLTVFNDKRLFDTTRSGYVTVKDNYDEVKTLLIQLMEEIETNQPTENRILVTKIYGDLLFIHRFDTSLHVQKALNDIINWYKFEDFFVREPPVCDIDEDVLSTLPASLRSEAEIKIFAYKTALKQHEYEVKRKDAYKEIREGNINKLWANRDDAIFWHRVEVEIGTLR